MNLDLSQYKVNIEDLIFVDGDTGDYAPVAIQEVYNEQSAPAFLSTLMLDCIRAGVSDIHFEPYQDKMRVRIRVDGVMREQASVPRGFGHLVLMRLKVIAGLDISEHRSTQTGRFRIMLGEDKSLDFRCSIAPTQFGETLVLRMLHLPEALLELSQLGLSQQQTEQIKHAVSKQQGMILVTGPTGSGKTVSLYTLLKQLNSNQRNIYTIEDPIEINLPGVNQININDKQDVSFAAVARTILRQDPDVIMLGEMRDQLTIDTAIQAAHTGHLVLSTLHATTAPKAISRLRNMEVDAYNIASTVTLIISQRLLRRLDPDNREQIVFPKERLLALGFKEEELAELKLYKAKPTESNPSGYKGRIGIFQVLPINRQLEKMIAAGAGDTEIEAWMQANQLMDLRSSALEKLKAGITDIDEVERVIGRVDNSDIQAAEKLLPQIEIGEED